MLDWGSDKIELLARYWGTEGLSLKEMSISFTKQFEAKYTRSAVAGKVMRIGLQKGKPIRREAIKRISKLLADKPSVRDAEIRNILYKFGYEEKAPAVAPYQRRTADTIVDPRKVVAAPPRSETEAETEENGKLSQAMAARSDEFLPNATGPNPFIWQLASNQCRFPADREGGFHTFCGCKTKEGSPYCDEHHKRCFTKARKPSDNPQTRKRHSRYAIQMH